MNSLLTPGLLLSAYAQGFFPMAGEDGRLRWYNPHPRAILPLDHFHCPRRLARVVQQEVFEIRLDTAFTAVMEACAAPAADRPVTWITPEMIAAYTALHHLGFAHSVESWQAGQLVGGLYGVSLGGFFAGESMFSRRPNASTVALVYLVRHLRQRGFDLLDVQFETPHLKRFGVITLPRTHYLHRLQTALTRPVHF